MLQPFYYLTKHKVTEIHSTKLPILTGEAFFIKSDKTSLYCGVMIRRTVELFYKNLGIPQASWLNFSLTKHICTPTHFSIVQWCLFYHKNLPALSSLVFLEYQCYCVSVVGKNPTFKGQRSPRPLQLNSNSSRPRFHP